MLMFVGLGNPGQKYEKNRHNIGFMAVDDIVHRHRFSPWKARFQGQVSEGRLGQEKILVLKPETYMNESGRAVGEAARFFKIPPEDIYVFYDELDLAPGKLRIKQAGGSGGHNGIKSIDAHIGKEYWRIRMGIGHPGHKDRVTGHVLGDFAKSEQSWLEQELDAISRHVTFLAQRDDSGFMSRVAQELAPPRPKKDKPETAEAKAAPQPEANKRATQQAEAKKTDQPAEGWQSSLARWLTNSKTRSD
ncbi:aminoacyl-tRNA hydrolase [Kiloniella laminariae]|uniref:Peptidyl-tRNA hydrolase n=1 Tax=Kiloniella laminariae TaxID=454162 RepID=A0ABT4LL63_9PROT|nr:aminoacyl-tRNA hydrolase [Kiloniella laminariae]MCZ4281857.1 aminoacyl-tRNA hydrolase [Kiloniella laminariae]